jgi:hypothetical protein
VLGQVRRQILRTILSGNHHGNAHG